MQIRHFTLNPFLENTYLLWDETRACVIVDPGCYTANERKQLEDFIREQDLKPVRLLNTHCHLDHIFGNHWVQEKYGLKPELTEAELPVLQAAPLFSEAYGMRLTPSPEPARFIVPGEEIRFGNTRLEVYSAPGHSPGHVVFLEPESRRLIAGDVLFRESIGRADLPGGNMETLMDSIFHTLLPLGDDVQVLPGHGPATTIGYERKHNPFLREWEEMAK